MSPARALSLCLLASCTEHLSIGSLAPEDASFDAAAIQPRLDAARADTTLPVQDAENIVAPPDAAPVGGLRASFRAFGQSEISSLTGNCAPCTEVEVVVEGGAPPYRIQWGDAQEGRTHALCQDTNVWIPDPSAPPNIVTVSDSSQPEPQIWPLNPALFANADCGDAEPGSWQVCITPRVLPDTPCPGIWHELSDPLTEPQASVSATFSIPFLVSTDVELYTATTLCGELHQIASGTIHSLANGIRGTTSAADAAPRYLLLRAPNEPAGLLPPGFSSTVQLCFER